MSKSNNTIYAILGLLCDKPMSGYDIKREAEEGIGNFWSESYGHLYPTLKKMLEHDIIVELEDTSEQKRKRRVYAITDKGRQILKVWLSKPCERFKLRDEFLLKLYFGKEVDDSVNIKHLENLKSGLEQRLLFMENIKAQLDTYCKDDPNYRYWKITLGSGFHTVKAKIAWCEESIKTLTK